jgi:hypothetical protein
MSLNRDTRVLLIALAVASLLALTVLAGCSSSPTTGTQSADTNGAKAAAAIAVSTLSTAAPDGKLLVGQSAAAITATSTPSWQFLIGSPKSDKIYAVMVSGGKGQFQEYGAAGLSADEWKQVPPLTDWKVDSTEAHTKAVAVHPSGKSAAYMMGFVTYVPKSAGSTRTKPMT